VVCDACRATKQTCNVCGQPLFYPPSVRVVRCPTCISAGRVRCRLCDKEVKARHLRDSHVVCTDCRPTLTCRGVTRFGVTEHARHCRGRYSYLPGKARVMAARAGTSVDLDAMTFVSAPCHRLDALVQANLDYLRRTLSQPVHSWAQFWELMGEVPGYRKAMQAKQRAPAGFLRGARGKRRLQAHLTAPDRSTAQLVRAWKQGSKWELRLCRLCGNLLMVSTAPSAFKPVTHQQCFFNFLQSDAGRRWKHQQSQSPQGIRVPRLKRPNRKTPDQLTRDFGIAVRHLLGRETQADLAQTYGRDAATVSRACRDIPNLLPGLEVADRRLARYVVAFGRFTS
jgi:hypothetical protein